MSSHIHEAALDRGVDHWNRWRAGRPQLKPDLSKAQLIARDLRGANLRDVDLEDADLSDARLGIDLKDPRFKRADLYDGSYLGKLATRQHGRPADLAGANLAGASLVGANLRWVNLDGVFARQAALCGAKLAHAGLDAADLRDANFARHDHHGRTDLRAADLNWANLLRADLREVDARGAVFRDAELGMADLRGADLSNANLRRSHIVETKLDGAVLRGAQVYGVSAWDISVSADTVQNDLVISRASEDPRIAVDDIRVAQFIYLLLDNRNIRTVIETIGRKGVLLLGRFSPERKAVLDELREELRGRGFLPIVFDFERAASRDITETVMILAGLSLFIIADITNPRSAPLELQATVPDYMTPFVPILERNEEPFAMFGDLKAKYDWVLDPLIYDTAASLRAVFEPAILGPALEMHERLVERKGRSVVTRDVRDFLGAKDPEG
jgi:uncharacterized protein YjbI with pentapeptide repeats